MQIFLISIYPVSKLIILAGGKANRKFVLKHDMTDDSKFVNNKITKFKLPPRILKWSSLLNKMLNGQLPLTFLSFIFPKVT